MPSFNVTAFQKFAFQTCAFQQEVATEYWAFQYEVFQWDSFQVEECQEETVVEYKVGTGGGTSSASSKNLLELHRRTKERNEERLRLDAERLADAERETAKVLARIARANEPEPPEPIVIPLPEAIEPEPVAKVEPLAPVNDLVEAVKESFTTDLDRLDATNSLLISEQISRNDEHDTIALLLILAEID